MTRAGTFLLTVILIVTAGCAERHSAVMTGYDVNWHLASAKPYAKWVEQQVLKNGETLFVDSEPLVVPADVKLVLASESVDFGGGFVNVELFPDAAKRVSVLTRIYRDRFIVFVVDGKPERAIQLTGQVSDHLVMSNFDSYEEAAMVEALLTGYGRDSF